MAKNDKILIDGIIDDRIELKLPTEKRDEAFEYFAFEQILKNYDLSSDDLLNGNVDGRNDGGIDGLFIFINGHLLSDPENFPWPKSGAVLELWVVTCKYHDTFKQAPLDNLTASLQELFDFSIESTELKGDYSERILRMRENLKLVYRKVSPRLSQFRINFSYASRGNTDELGDSIISRSKQIMQITKEAFGNCEPMFSFLGSTELIELHRKMPNFSLDLPVIEHLSRGETYILLVKLKDYYDFIQDDGKLRRYLFDSNVRDFMGLNRVNEDIRNTLSIVDSPDFWWLNNGITILSTKAVAVGKVIQIEDIQIVNGLQTSESIFRHFESGGSDPQNRAVLIKVIVSRDDKVRDAIIRATNNQTTVEISSLHATDRIQRDIEDILKESEYYYERRTNFYKNQGITPDKIVTPLYIGAGYLNLVLKNADQASKLKSKFMRVESSYEKVFSQNTDLRIWPQIAYILKNTDLFLETVRPVGKGNTENFLKSRRQVLSFITVSKILGTFNFSVSDLINLDLEKYDSIELLTVWNIIKKSIAQVNNTRVKKSVFINLCKKAEDEWQLKGIERVINAKDAIIQIEKKKEEVVAVVAKVEIKEPVTLEFAMKVNELLPKQPWKPGVHLEICEKLKCSKSEYFEAVKLLIDEGLRYNQKDGVVFDEDGNVISFDKERVDADTLRLKDDL